MTPVGPPDATSESVGLLISLLVRYPEVATINYEPQAHALKFTFIIREVLSSDRIRDLEVKLAQCLDAFSYLTKRGSRLVSLQASIQDRFTFLEIKRDMFSLSEEEISLLIGLLREEFGNSLVSEPSDPMLEEELLAQENLIGHMLENVKEKVSDKRLIAFREEGKVLVFANRNRL
ncbi:MAG: hypothetical protein ACPLRW_10505 [Moorellales bacterium]